ncbi:MAG TPA: alkaline phosphatase family protein, partial [Acidimicrobiales bacterium]|nr:alkaline phosphatase family protein [Acidimicrobiales bacterium]
MRQVKTLSLFTVAAGTMLLGAVAGLAGAEAATVPPVGGPVSAATAPHIMTIMMENTDYSQFVGSPAMPFLNEMAHEYVDFTQAFGWHYPSLPNYLELLSGWREKVSGDCDINQKGCRDFTNPTLATQLEARGLSWNAYYQGDPRGCYQGDGSGNYPYWHNPFRY